MLRQLGLVRLDNSVDPGWRVLGSSFGLAMSYHKFRERYDAALSLVVYVRFQGGAVYI